MKESDKGKTIKGYILVVISACAFGTMGIANRIAYNHGADVGTLMSSRFLIVTLFYIIYMRFRGLSWRVPLKKGLVLIALGFVFYSNVVFFFYKAVQYISPTAAGLILYIYPAVVCVLGHFFLNERLNLQKIVSLFIVTVGCGLVVGGPMAEVAGKGIMYAILTVLFYSVYIVGNRKILNDVHPVTTAAYMGASCAVYFLLRMIIQGSYAFSFDPVLLVVVLVLAFWCTITGIICFFKGMIILGASKSSIVSTVEPLYTALAAWIILGDTISVVQWIGGTCILTGVVFLRFRKRKRS